jgi:hypothetical protein
MKNEISIATLLQWRLKQAETTAPPAPAPWRLLASVRPWWETWPEQFRAAAEQLGKIKMAYGYAMAAADQPGGGHPIPVLIIHGEEKMESSARVLYFHVHEGRLRLRFLLEDTVQPAPQGLEVTFVASQMHPVISARAMLSVDNQYRMDIELPELLAQIWEQLRVTDQMPFQFIAHPVKDNDEGTGHFRQAT